MTFSLRRRKDVFQFVAVLNALLFFSYLAIVENSNEARKYSNSVQFKTEERNKSGCILQIPDPWDKSISEFFSKYSSNHASAKFGSQSAPVTVLENGVLSIMDENYSCAYRCFEMGSDGLVNYDDWIVLKESHSNISCEFTDVECGEREREGVESESDTYRMAYAQAVKKAHLVKDSNAESRPNVVIIVLDSVSRSSTIRKLPKTLNFLRDHLKLVEFTGHAKVGLNSHPNAAAFFTGRLVETSNVDEHYKHSKSIWFDFKRYGFITFISDDDNENGLFSTGDEPPKDYFLWPYWEQLTLLKKWPEAWHRISLKYLNKMLKMYKNQPVFAMNWITSLSHDQADDLDDDFFLEFFQNSSELLRNSFVIFMADHGMRFGELRSTKVGRMEDNLPFFSIAVPERFRTRADLMANLQANSKLLTSHFDIYVTLWDMLLNDFVDFSKQLDWTFLTPATRGESLLRPLNSERTCQSLEIPLQYCPCEENLEKFDDAKLSSKLAQFVVDEINYIIPQHQCETVYFERILEVERLTQQSTNESDIFRITLKTEPNKGIFQVMLRMMHASRKIYRIGLIDRINRYGNTSYCINDFLIERYCLCRLKNFTNVYAYD